MIKHIDMKRLYKNVSGLFLTGILSLGLALTASAQHGHGGGGGGSVGGGGGGSRGISSIGGYSGHSASASSFRNTNSFAAVRAGAVGAHSTSAYRTGAVRYNSGSYYRPGVGFYGYPYLGFYLGALPYGYYPFYWGDDLFYYSSGIFYRPYDGGGYEVTVPPVGAAIPSLPEGAKSITINGEQYYELNGVYYKAVVNDQNKTMYEVAGRDGVLNTDNSTIDSQDAMPKVGDIVDQLPDNCHKVSLNGKKFFVSPNGIYYEAFADEDGNINYRIASIPDPNDQQD